MSGACRLNDGKKKTPHNVDYVVNITKELPHNVDYVVNAFS